MLRSPKVALNFKQPELFPSFSNVLYILSYTHWSEHLRSNKFHFFPHPSRYQPVPWVNAVKDLHNKPLYCVSLPTAFQMIPHIFQDMFILKSPLLEVVLYSEISFHHIPFWKTWGWLPFLIQIPSVVLRLCTQGCDHIYMSSCMPRPSHSDLLQTLTLGHHTVTWQVSTVVPTVSTLLFIHLIQPTSWSFSCFSFCQWMEDQHLPLWFHHVGYFKLSQLMAVTEQSW